MDVVNENSKPLEDALHDTDRVDFFRGYIGYVEKAIDAGCNVIGYFLWSLMDKSAATHLPTSRLPPPLNPCPATDRSLPCRGVCAGSYEWADGYSKRFGIHYVDYAHNTTRYAKDSAKWYTQLIHNTTGNVGRMEREEREAKEQQERGGRQQHKTTVAEL